MLSVGDDAPECRTEVVSEYAITVLPQGPIAFVGVVTVMSVLHI
jgi:hypothetical protein